MSPPTEPGWLTLARRYLALREIPGPRHHPQILAWFDRIGAGWYNDDETPWCAAFVGGVLEEAGIRSSRSAAARSYLTWGQRLVAPHLGSIVVFERGAGGHVGFVTGHDTRGRIRVLGGNQSNAVTEAWFERGRVLGYRHPPGTRLPGYVPPLLAADGSKVSEDEA